MKKEVMTKEEAINFLRDCLNDDEVSVEYHPNVSLPTTPQPKIGQWILTSERLPEDDTEVIVSCTDDSGDSEFSYTTTGWHYKGIWIVGNERNHFVKAWMPLPEPYKVESE